MEEIRDNSEPNEKQENTNTKKRTNKNKRGFLLSYIEN